MLGFDPTRTASPGVASPQAPTREGRGVIRLETSLGPMAVSLHPFGARLRLGAKPANDYGLLVGPVEEELAALREDDGAIVVEGARHTLLIDKTSLAVTLKRQDRTVLRSSTDGHFTKRHRLAPFSRTPDGWLAHFHLDSGEHVYGLGEKWSALNKRGQVVHSYNHDALGVNAEASYKNAPFAWSPAGWGVFVHTPAPVTHGVGFAPWSHRAYGVLVEDDSLDLFLFSGENGAQLLEQYTDLTGRAPEPPTWSLGVIVSKAYYQDSDELLAKAREIRRRRMPCDTITLDGRAWLETEKRFAFEWDKTRYPDPKGILDELKSMNFKVCVWEYPLISVKNPLYDEMAANGWLLKHRDTGETYRYVWDREPFGDVLTPLPDSGVVDFTHPQAYAYWRDRHEELFSVGVDMIKADFGEQVTDDMLAHNGETGRRLHNVYAFLYNKCVYEAAEKFAANGPFLFSRASWTGCQRFPAQWGGDPQADWEGLAASLRGGLAWGLTGAPFYATDVGGFYADQRDPKLYVRWIQAAVFSAHMRLHGIGDREPWTYGPIAEDAAIKALQLRYRLLPYLREAVRDAHAAGLPVQRAMALARPDDPASWSFENQFFFGDRLLVAPCVREDDRVSVYLPSGEWRRFPDGEVFSGGRQHELTLALDEIAVFAPRGAEIPLAPALEHTGQFAPDDPAEIWIAQ
ncbi:MAG: TIM-barrel domain-containing protein [Pseudomonadota bacterium]